MPSPTVSVLTTVYNGERFLAEAVESILEQTYTDFELVVVDDGSDDGSVKVIENFDDHRIRLVQNWRNRGRAEALNHGLFECNGEYVAIQDADDISEPSRIERQVKLLEACDNEVAVIATGYERHFETSGRSELVDPSANHAAMPQVLARYNPIAHSTTMIRRQALEEVGGYNVHLDSCIDYDLWVRLADAGYRFRFLRDPLSTIRKHDDRSFDFRGRQRLRRAFRETEVAWRAVDVAGGTHIDYGRILLSGLKRVGEGVL